jgi:hypothetical protein
MHRASCHDNTLNALINLRALRDVAMNAAL